ncbi:hypothetical protein B0H11DRAFT_1933453 [Mycena galericulata]|nr:hypothetical protein B0H11DRAFT_1933453 [Mycena galericulata]
MNDDTSQFETATGSSWFEIASNTMQLPLKDGSFLIRIACARKDDFNSMKTKLAVGQLLDVQVEFIRRDFQDETHTVLRRGGDGHGHGASVASPTSLVGHGHDDLRRQ